MKMLLFSLVISASFSAFASVPSKLDCKSAAQDIAKMNLDQRARAYQFSESDIPTNQNVEVSENKKAHTTSYIFEGYIYKGTYSVSVEVDSLCGVEFVSIKETN